MQITQAAFSKGGQPFSWVSGAHVT
jgi:hypothetical protein